MNPIYRHKIQVDDGTPRQVYPDYKDDLAISYEKESSQQFFRRKLSGKIDFVGRDFDFLMQQSFEAVYYHIIEISTDNGFTWSEYWRGKFMQTDCTVNINDKKITVQPDVIDQYNEVLAGLEKEYNLVELAPVIERVTITKRVALQVYFAGDTRLTSVVNGLSFETDCDEVTSHNTLINDYHFASIGRRRRLTLTKDGNVYGYYDAIVPLDWTVSKNITFSTADGETKVNLLYEQPMSQNPPTWTYRLMDASNHVLYEYTGNEDKVSFDMQPTIGQTGTIHCDVSDVEIYSRMLLDVESYDGNATYAISSNDFCYDNRNYRRCFPYAVSDDVVYSNYVFSDEPTQWGRTNDGQYFTYPDGVGTDNGNFFPIGRNKWIYCSYWLWDDITLSQPREYYGNKKYEVSTNYPLWSVISVLLGKVATGITFAGTSAYSQLLYGTTSFGLADTPLMMTPKSNVLAGEFSQPAMKASITLKDVLNMLKNVFQAYWYIGTDGKFHVEHVSYFKNGGSYSSSPTVGIDLTTLQVSRNGKAWAFATSDYSFEKEDMPERYQFEWMDEVTEAFVGVPIEIISKYVKQGKIENITISQFTTDVDYILLAPEDISKDGFALFACQLQSGVYVVPINTVAMQFEPRVQNYVLSFRTTQPKYWTDDLPARSVKINDEEYTVTGMMQRNKKQELSIPTGDTDPDIFKLVTTGIGNGQIDKMSINLSSRMAKTTLRYDTEQEQ